MIEVVKVEDKILGNIKAHDLLKRIVDDQTLLVLSGGTSPDYDKIIIHPRDILPGAICLGDERFGAPYHMQSNELKLKNFGINDFVSIKGIDYFRILTGEDSQTIASKYNIKIADLFVKFPKRVGIMGVGADLHTSAIFPNSVALSSGDYVVSQMVNDRQANRITLTIKALSEFTNFIILMFGAEKKEALMTLLNQNETDMNKYPAVFYRTNNIKSFLITDIDI